MKRIYGFLMAVYRIIWRAKKFIWRALTKHIYLDTLEARRDFLKYYNSEKPLPRDYPKTVIFMADGKIFVGGLADRLRGIISVYKLCKKLNLAFKINFSSPFNLNEYLLPNAYDWTISPDEICYNRKYARPCFVWPYGNFFFNIWLQAFWAKFFLREKYKQIHIYTSIFTAEKEYGLLFKELFKTSPELESLIDYHVKILGGEGGFISVAFRFEQLLGDFKEPDGRHPALPDNKKKTLIDKCINDLTEIYKENDCGKALITSDSVTFLEEVKCLPFVYVIPGDVCHIEVNRNTDKGVNLKLFLDHFVLSRSKKVYLVIEDQMYDSGFSYRAAMLNNVPFIKWKPHSANKYMAPYYY